MKVAALVTAGVRSNAVRMSSDEGKFYEPGTINIILMTNCRLTARAMSRAIITATEAKTAALQDLDIRSTHTGRFHQATGTGTDNIIVVEGDGVRIDNAGGHSKMGELVAKAVYYGVMEAIFKQNGIIRKRNVFQRLKERRISIYDLIPDDGLKPLMSRMQAGKTLEALLLEPKYAAFIETALAVSDQAEIGLIKNLNMALAVDRRGSGKSFLGFLKGFGLRQGACGSTMCWDTPDMIILGCDQTSMNTVIGRLREIGGGAVYAMGGEVVAEFPATLCGIVSLAPMEAARDQIRRFEEALKQNGVDWGNPLLTLNTQGNAAIPHFRLTHQGYVRMKDREVLSLRV